MPDGPFSQDVVLLKRSLGNLPEPLARPVLVLVSGLPGSGKSYFSRKLAERFPLLILETDHLRRVLFSQPTHSTEESSRLFEACHLLIDELLSRGIPLVFDATNLVEHHREYLYSIAEHRRAKLIIVRLQAPKEVVLQRLESRAQGNDPGDHSSASQVVYQRMRGSQQPIRRNHYTVDTSEDLGPVLAKILREIQQWERV